jgi:Protein of unknown function (DUF3263)
MDTVAPINPVPQAALIPSPSAPPLITPPALGPIAPAPVAPTPTTSGSALSDQEVSILTFERQWWRFAGAKEQAIRDNFGMSPTRYYQTLNAMLESADAMAHDPALVKRLRRLRASRLRSRARG